MSGTAVKSPRESLGIIDGILRELANDISRADFNEEKMATAIARLTARAEREQALYLNSIRKGR